MGQRIRTGETPKTAARSKHVEIRRLASNTPGLPLRPRVPDLLFLQLALDGLDLLGERPVIAD